MYYSEKKAARLINSMFSSIDNSRPGLKKAWIDEKGRMCACDGFRAYRLNVPVAGVPDEDREQGLDLDRIFPASIDDYKPLDLPTVDELKAMIEEDRRAQKRGGVGSNLFTFGMSEDGEVLPAANLGYLLDMLELFPNARAYWLTRVKPIVFKDENGDAILMPVSGNPDHDKNRRLAPVLPKKDKTPAMGLRTFAAIYAN